MVDNENKVLMFKTVDILKLCISLTYQLKFESWWRCWTSECIGVIVYFKSRYRIFKFYVIKNMRLISYPTIKLQIFSSCSSLKTFNKLKNKILSFTHFWQNIGNIGTFLLNIMTMIYLIIFVMNLIIVIFALNNLDCQRFFDLRSQNL